MSALRREPDTYEITGTEAIEERRRAQAVARFQDGIDHTGAAAHEDEQEASLGILGIFLHALHDSFHDVRIAQARVILFQLQAVLLHGLASRAMNWSPVPLALIQFFQPTLYRLTRHRLQTRIDGGLDRQAKGAELVGAELLDQLAMHTVDRLGHAVRARAALGNHGDGLLGQLARRPFVDELQLRHLPEHVGLTLLGRLGVLVGRQPRRRLQHARQQRGLGNVDFTHWLAKVETRRLLHTVTAMTEVHLVEVQLEDSFFGELLRDPARQDDLLHLAPHGLLG